MRGNARSGRTRGSALLASAALLAALGGCADEGFDRNPRRPPVPLQLSGVITNRSVDVEPAEIGAGPVVLTLANQTAASHTISLEGGTVAERVGPINPGDTATLQAALPPGRYEVKAGSERAMPREIRPALLVISPQRRTGEDELELP